MRPTSHHLTFEKAHKVLQEPLADAGGRYESIQLVVCQPLHLESFPAPLIPVGLTPTSALDLTKNHGRLLGRQTKSEYVVVVVRIGTPDCAQMRIIIINGWTRITFDITDFHKR